MYFPHIIKISPVVEKDVFWEFLEDFMEVATSEFGSGEGYGEQVRTCIGRGGQHRRGY